MAKNKTEESPTPTPEPETETETMTSEELAASKHPLAPEKPLAIPPDPPEPEP